MLWASLHDDPLGCIAGSCCAEAVSFLFEPLTWAKVMFGPLNGAQYRLVGPGAEPKLAREILSRIPTMPWPVLAWEAMFLFGSKLLHLLGAGDRFKPIGVGIVTSLGLPAVTSGL